MDLKELNKQISDIDKQTCLLSQRRRALEEQKIEEFQKQAVEHVGRCFKVNGDEYAIVIDVPQNSYDRTDRSMFNEYQFPAVYLNDETIPFSDGTLFSGAWKVGKVMVGEYVEISLDEFKEEFEKRIDKLRNICFGNND